jgi:ABC-type multidrug transport system fused ATPase/permease subunit
MSNRSYFQLLIALWRQLRSRRHTQLKWLTVLMLLASVAEMVGIGAVVPFLGVITNPTLAFDNELAQRLVAVKVIRREEEILFLVTGFFVCVIALVAVIRTILLWVSTRLAFSIGLDLGNLVYLRNLKKPYVVHATQNTADVINAIVTQTNFVTTNVVLATINLVSNTVLCLGILIGLILVEPRLTAVLILFFMAFYLCIGWFTRIRLTSNGQMIAVKSPLVVKSIQEGLGAIRDVIIDGTYDEFAKKYSSTDKQVRFAMGNNHFLGQAPRFLIESLGIISIAGSALFFVKNGADNVITGLAVIALGAQKALPLVQRIFLSYANAKGARGTLESLLLQIENVHDEKLASKEISFEREIAVEGLGFSYDNGKTWAVRGVTFTVRKGDRVGIVGPSGGGKTTLADMLLGLLDPREGCIKVDGQILGEDNVASWRQLVSVVPQNIFLKDSSIKENIAFGVKLEDIDEAAVREAAQLAELHTTISSWELGYDSRVGERGARLSGGQVQRIGIARAFYKKAKIIVLDEFTSAIDRVTEEKILKNIVMLNRDNTFFIISHRESNLSLCSKVLSFDKSGRLTITSH